MRTTTARRTRCALAATALAVSAAMVSGCSSVTPAASASGTPSDSVSASSSSAPSPSSSSSSSAPASIAVTPADGATKVAPDAKVTVTAAGGSLARVAVKAADGGELAGSLSKDGTTWTSSAPLAVKSTYTVTAQATNPDGAATELSSSLRTLTPKDSADYSVLPAGSGPVGVGMPVVIQFAGLVSKDKQDDIERQVAVTTSPKVAGAWGWLDARQLIWRPAAYWAPGTKVTVKADLAGIQTRPGFWTVRNAEHSFTVGSAMVSTVDVKNHTLTVRRDGKVLRTIPVTTGKPGFATRNGTKIIISRETSRQMDAETTGLSKSDPEYYNINVKYAMRLTWSGEFLHAAPWSVGSQGRSNVSHGCTGMSTANAKWLFDRSKMGDVVTYVGSKRALEDYNGYTMWNMSLVQWAKRSAITA